MDRIINVKVGGNHLNKDNKNAGVRGEANVTILRITFDEGWDNYTKKITFWDARGLNPVVVSLLPHSAEGDARTYLVPIPSEPMQEAGMLTFVIEGTIDDKVQRSLSDRLEVKDAPIAENAGQPVPPTPDDLTQLAGEIEKIKADILESRDAKELAEQAKEESFMHAKNSQEFAMQAEQNATETLRNRYEAETYAQNALDAISHSPVIEAGEWWIWSATEGIYNSTGIKAQAGSTVYLGDNPPSNADVWIQADGESSDFEDYINSIIRKMHTVKTTTVTLLSSEWVTESDYQHSQVVAVEGVTPCSKVDLQPSVEQLAIFHEKDITFVTENDGGVITVYCIGQKPANDYSMQATITEVNIDG